MNKTLTFLLCAFLTLAAFAADAATSYPGALDTLSNPSASDKLNAGSGHADQHADANDAIEALQAKVGANSSAVTTSHDYKLARIVGDTYTPTAVIDINVDTQTLYDAQYIRAGGIVTVSGRVDITPTGSGATSLSLSLPVASAFSATSDCAGAAIATSVKSAGEPYNNGYVSANTAQDAAAITFDAGGTTEQTFYYTYTYRIRS